MTRAASAAPTGSLLPKVSVDVRVTPGELQEFGSVAPELEFRRLVTYWGPVTAASDRTKFGVAPSVEADEAERRAGRRLYVERALDRRLRQLVTDRHQSFVLLVGESAAGKSRAAWEACLAESVGPCRVLVPNRDDPTRNQFGRICELMGRSDPPAPDARLVLWLDDVHHFLTSGKLTRTTLHAFRDAGFLVLATIRRSDYERLRDYSARHRSAASQSPGEMQEIGAALQLATELYVPTRLDTAAERAEAARYFGQRGWDGRGVGEVLVLGPELLRKFRSAAWAYAAIVCAAIDWQRIGHTRPIPRARLEALWQDYVAWRGDHQATEAEPRFDEVLEWAAEPLADSSSALLSRQPSDFEGHDGYAAHDYLVDYRDREEGEPHQEPVPEPMWRRVRDALSTELLPFVVSEQVRSDALAGGPPPIGTLTSAFGLEPYGQVVVAAPRRRRVALLALIASAVGASAVAAVVWGLVLLTAAAANRPPSTAATARPTTELSISPNLGPAGTRVTITGSGFAAGEQVQIKQFFWGVVATPTADSEGRFAAALDIPSEGPAPFDAGIQAIGQSSGRKAAATFSVQRAIATAGPASFRISPNFGAAGTSVTIVGTGFQPGEQVLLKSFFWGVIAAPNADSAGGFTVTLRIPPGGPVPFDAGIEAIGQSSKRTASVTFTVQRE